MNYIDVSDLEPGQTFTHPVFIESDTIFVPAGVPIRDKDIKRLQDWQVERVETEGTAWATVAPQKTLEEIWGLPTDGEFNVFYIQTVERMNHLFSRIRNNEEVAESEIDDIVQSIIQKVEDKEVDAVRLVLMSGNNSTDLGMSAVSIGLLSVSVGLTLTRPRHKLYHLCTGAILHDVDMQRIPQNLIALERGLRPHELKTLRTHPLHSYRIVSEELQLADEMAQIVLQHHERWYGEGYPQGRKGADIIYESRIISVLMLLKPWFQNVLGVTP